MRAQETTDRKGSSGTRHALRQKYINLDPLWPIDKAYLKNFPPAINHLCYKLTRLRQVAVSKRDALVIDTILRHGVLIQSEPRYEFIEPIISKVSAAWLGLSPGQTDSQVDASQRKFAKAELAYGLAKGG